MKNDYILTLQFSTKRLIDKLCGVKTFELIQEIGNAIRRVFDIYQLDIKSSCLKMGEQSLAEQDDEVCVNADCPMCADYCPVVDVTGVCRFEERGFKNE